MTEAIFQIPEPATKGFKMNQYRLKAVAALAFALLLNLNILAKTDAKPDPNKLVENALTAMGGAENIAGIRTLKFTALSHKFLLEQSERPAGPWIVSYEEITEIRDHEKSRMRQETEMKSPAIGALGKMTFIAGSGVGAFERGGKQFPAGSGQLFETEEWLELAPERVLLAARAAGDLRAEADTVLQDVPHHRVVFSWRGAPVTVFLNAHTGLPTAVEAVRANPYDFFWGIWGDFPSRTYFSFWTLEPGGIRYPHQWDVVRNGQPSRTLTLSSVEFNPTLNEADFTISEEAKTQFAARAGRKIADLPLGRPDRPAKELAPGVVLVQGFWNVTLVKQDDGIVIIEAPISSGYSAKAIAEAEKRFPGMKIKAAISTSDAWPHLGGAREYAARGIPLYILDVNRPIISQLLDAKYKTSPDALATTPRKADLKVVSGKTTIGTGANRLDLYPMRTETGERMIMIHFPEHQLLYASDLVQMAGGGKFFMPQYLTEVESAVNREKISVNRVFAMHSDAVEWKAIQAGIAEAVGKKSP